MVDASGVKCGFTLETIIYFIQIIKQMFIKSIYSVKN